MRRIGRLVLLVSLAGACRGVETSYDYPEDLFHPNYIKRSKAVREFARRRDTERLPDAFDLLLDREAHIRALAWDTIRRITGKDFEYRPYLDERTRAGIVARWRADWEASGRPAVLPEPGEEAEAVEGAAASTGSAHG
ncbi:MAG: hypothetical protein ACE5JG_07795 [Planctomycetota bacterium]